MPTFEPKVDAYIIKSQEFAKPVLEYLRGVVHKASPGIEEAIKWGMPGFIYKGKILCAMAAFKQHCSFGFWMENSMETIKPIREANNGGSATGMGSFGKITHVNDLPSEKTLLQSINEAIMLVDSGVKLNAIPAKKATAPEVPDALAAALAKNKTAKAVFEKASPSFRKEYIQWVLDAKTDATREKRIATTIEWVSEGKGRNWRYEKKK